MTCPRCASPTTESDVFCGQCGANLTEARSTCPQCGRVNEPGGRFCTACGATLAGAAPAEPVAAGPIGTPAPPPSAAPPPAAIPAPAPPAWAPPEMPGTALPRPPGATVPVMPPPPGATLPPPPETVTFPSQQAAAPPPFPAPQPQPGYAASAAPATDSVGGFKLARPLSLAGAAVAAVGAFLGWVKGGFGQTANGFDVPVNFLIDYQTNADHAFTVGLIVLVVAVGAGLLTVLPNLADRLHLLRPLGIALLVVAGLFIVQLVRLSSDFGISFGDIYAFGPFVAGAGGVLLLVGK